MTEPTSPQNAARPAAACPKCKDETGGYRYVVVIERIVEGNWGERPFACDEHELRVSMVECIGCGAKFQFKRLQEKGIAQ